MEDVGDIIATYIMPALSFTVENATELGLKLVKTQTDWSGSFSIWPRSWQEGELPLTSVYSVAATAVLYLLFIFSLKLIMSCRSPFELVTIGRLHNLILSVWSLYMCIGMGISAWKLFTLHGFRATFCLSDHPDYADKEGEYTGGIAYWMYMFFLSKYYELFDTVLLVLKKKQLKFIHVYHHAIVGSMVYSWLRAGAVPYAIGAVLWNTFIHVFMYYYYYLASFKADVWWRRYITNMQIVQFCTSFFLLPVLFYYHFWGYGSKGEGEMGCKGMEAVWYTLAINFTLLLLFVNFLVKDKKRGKKEADKKRD
mmetsp:Transcript_49723/g.127898  ORF Transcript_49723/g.127898 Transcript_49723/m.127898 type:complete len:310 (-) Transcript_49723:273-1202(-)